MRKGGYKIVDFKGAELTSTVVVRPGIYSQIIDDYDKTILVSGVSLSGTLKDDSFASVNEITGDSGDSVELGVYGGVITITEDDEVSFTASKSNAELAEEIGDLDDLDTTEKDSVVEAINEVVGSVGDTNEILDKAIKTIDFSNSQNVSIEAGALGTVIVDTFEVPTGYSILGIGAITSGNQDFLLMRYFADATDGLRLYLRNISNSTATGKPGATVIFAKSSIVDN